MRLRWCYKDYISIFLWNAILFSSLLLNCISEMPVIIFIVFWNWNICFVAVSAQHHRCISQHSSHHTSPSDFMHCNTRRTIWSDEVFQTSLLEIWLPIHGHRAISHKFSSTYEAINQALCAETSLMPYKKVLMFYTFKVFTVKSWFPPFQIRKNALCLFLYNGW